MEQIRAYFSFLFFIQYYYLQTFWLIDSEFFYYIFNYDLTIFQERRLDFNSHVAISMLYLFFQ